MQSYTCQGFLLCLIYSHVTPCDTTEQAAWNRHLTRATAQNWSHDSHSSALCKKKKPEAAAALHRNAHITTCYKLSWTKYTNSCLQLKTGFITVINIKTTQLESLKWFKLGWGWVKTHSKQKKGLVADTASQLSAWYSATWRTACQISHSALRNCLLSAQDVTCWFSSILNRESEKAYYTMVQTLNLIL